MMTKIYRGALLLFVFSMAACSSGPPLKVEDYPEDPVFTAKTVLPEDYQANQASNVYDPWEGMNKHIYNFNYHFDRYIFLPTVRGYEFVTPGFAQSGVSNFFDNIKDVNTFFNSVLQLSPKKSAQSLGRVAINSTIGIVGLFDVAGYFGIDRPQEDFGQTLGHYGVGNGPYLVLPILGPSNLRDGVGLIPDYMVNSYVQDWVVTDFLGIDDDYLLAFSVLDAIQTRSRVSFRYYETGSAFEYNMVRWLYTTKRELDIDK
jgi:phospholipid-binding lipoprotein MlaA